MPFSSLDAWNTTMNKTTALKEFEFYSRETEKKYIYSPRFLFVAVMKHSDLNQLRRQKDLSTYVLGHRPSLRNLTVGTADRNLEQKP